MIMREIKSILFNATGITNKFELLKFETLKNEIDIWFITETWLKKEHSLHGFHVLSAVNTEQAAVRGSAGCSIFIRNSIDESNFKVISKDDSTGRYIIVQIFGIVFCLVYLSPNISTEKFTDILTQCVRTSLKTNQNRVVVLGDYNSHLK